MNNTRMARITGAIACVLLFTVFITGCNQQGKQTNARGANMTNVKAEGIKKQAVITYVEYPSKIDPINTYSVTSAGSGIVEKVNYDVGATVNKGDVLYSIDQSSTKAQYNQQQANLAALEANKKSQQSNYEKTNSSTVATLLLNDQKAVDSASAQVKIDTDNLRTVQDSYEPSLKQANENVSQAQLAYSNAQKSYNDNLSLFESGAISKQALDSLKNTLDTAESRFNAANASLEIVKAQQASAVSNANTKLQNDTLALENTKKTLELNRDKVAPETVNAAAAQVAAASAQVNAATAQLQGISVQMDNNMAKSPISGVVSTCNVRVGELSSASKVAFTIIDTSSLIAQTEVPDSMVNKLTVNQAVKLKVSSLNNKQLDGTIYIISPSSDATTKTYTVKVKLNSPDATIRPGMFATIMLPAEKKDNVLTVPNETIVIENGIRYLYTVVDNAVKKAAITAGLSNETITEVSGNNIKEGLLVIIEGQIFLKEGQKVNTAPGQQPSPANQQGQPQNKQGQPDPSKNKAPTDKTKKQGQ